LFLLVLAAAIAIYYPSRQKTLFTDNYREILRKTGRTIALGVEFSLKAEDFNGLVRTYEYVRTDSIFDFIAIYTVDSLSKKNELLVMFPDSTTIDPSNLSLGKYLFEDIPYQASGINGFVRVGILEKTIRDRISTLNRPIYLAILFSFIVLGIILFYIANLVARPLLTFAQLIDQPRISIPDIRQVREKSYGEVRTLADNFLSLQERVEKEQSEKDNLLNTLDQQVRARTAQLEDARVKLINSQRMASLGSFEYYPDTDRFECSESMAELFGEMPQKDRSNFLHRVHPQDASRIAPFFQAHAKGTHLNDTVRMRDDLTGKVLWVRILCHAGVDEQARAVVNGTLQDITRQRQAEEEITRLSFVAEETSNSVIITDPYKQIVWANASFLAMTGYTFDEIRGQTPRMFQFEKTDPETVQMINRMLSNHQTIRNLEILNRGKAGKEYWLDLNIFPYKSRSGELLGYIGVETDITERKKMEEDLRSLNQELERKVIDNTQRYLDLTRAYTEQEKLAAIGEVAAGVAHDLNTPMSTILIGAESLVYHIGLLMGEQLQAHPTQLIREAHQLAARIPKEIFVSGSQLEEEKMSVGAILETCTGLSAELRDPLRDKLVKCRITGKEAILELLQHPSPLPLLAITEQIQTITSLTETITNATRRSSTVIQNLREYITKTDAALKRPISLYNSIVAALNIFSYSFGGRVRIDMHVPADINIPGNDIKLFQLWSNLIKNAGEAMRETAHPILKIIARIEGNMVCVSFENNGPPIPEESLKDIFTRFFTTKSRLSGSGLGLTIVQAVVKEHGGTIGIRSVAASTTFDVRLPIA
jgi:PAS domain S-box-containing protein